MQNLDLVILAGGKGTRIKKFTNGKPKPLVKINKTPFISYLLNHYSKFNFNKIYILAGYKGYLLKKKYHNKIVNTCKIKVIIERTPMDTGGALFPLKKLINNDFVLVNGDSILKLSKLQYFKYNYMFLTRNLKYKTNSKLNGINIGKENNLRIDIRSKLMNAGVYYLKSNFLNNIKNKKISIETELLPGLIKEKKIKGIFSGQFFLDIGTPNSFINAPKLLKNNFYRPAVFLDRDGVINYDKGYTYKYDKFKFKPHVIKALKFLVRKNYYIFIVTNQAGIAKGYYTESAFLKLHKKINSYLAKYKIYIDDLQYCPYHIKAKIKKYKKNSKFRKPGNLMILDLLKKWHVDKSKSFMIGDRNSDLIAAKKSKIYFEFDKDNLYKQSSLIISKFKSKNKIK